MKRREFIKSSISGSAALMGRRLPYATIPLGLQVSPKEPQGDLPGKAFDLTPARWIWYPSGRCLPNTFVLFRREIHLPSKPRSARGWVAADSRYLLEVNGKRIQWGPAPSDPRWLEVDPVELTEELEAGTNILGATVLFYGQGDGTSPLGKPGFIFRMEIESAGESTQSVVSDENWKAFLARSWPPGHYKRYYLRSLQEEFDARVYPYGWGTAAFVLTEDWLPAMALDCPPDKPPICSTYPDYLLDTEHGNGELRVRSVPLMREYEVAAKALAESLWIEWLRSPEEYFECRPPEAFRAVRQPAAQEIAPDVWQVELEGTRGSALTFEFAEQMVGWPYFTIEAPGGCVVELMVHEAHQVGGSPLLNTHYDSWSRFICRPGENRFEAFDYESFRWMQLHIHGSRGRVTVRNVGMRRRIFPWPNPPHVRFSEPALQRLMEASVNTVCNSALETVMDGVGRERQQYSGDVSPQLHAVELVFGETRLPRRFLATYSQGLALEGYFADCWPAYDRLARMGERELQLTPWGPLLDHGVMFNFDNYYYYLYTGDLSALKEPYPRLWRFFQYLVNLVGRDGLLPVEDLGIPAVWMDHMAYQRQRHRQCAFNLFAAAMMQHALAPICIAFGDPDRAQAAKALGKKLEAATVGRFWSPERGLFVVNLPWLREEGIARLCDRSLATAILFDQCPEGNTVAAVRALADCPPEMGFSYPANAGWRLWALGKAGRADMVVKDFRQRWASMDSVRLNNTLQEFWLSEADSDSEWSHCGVVPLYVTTMSLAGIRPLEPGFKRCEIRPQLADLETLELTAYTVKGPIDFSARGKKGTREVTVKLPDGCAGELVVPREEALNLPPARGTVPGGHRRYRLPAGGTSTVRLKYS